jgi:hypothetical protein
VKEAASGILYQNIDYGDGARDRFVALNQPRQTQIKCTLTVILHRNPRVPNAQK